MILKSFIRKKTTKIYFVIICLIMTALTIITCFEGYFEYLKNKIYSDNSVLIVEGKKNYYDFFINNNNVKNVERTLILSSLNTDEGPFVNCSYEIFDANGNVIEKYDSNSENELSITWEDIYIDYHTNDIIVKNSKDRNKNLMEHEVEVGIRKSLYNQFEFDKSFEKYIGENIKLKLNDEQLNFQISNIYSSDKFKGPEILISEQIFNELLMQEEKYIYTMNIVNYQEVNNIIHMLEKKDLDTTFSIKTFFENGEGYQISSIYSLLGYLSLASVIFIIVFIIVLIVILKNIIIDSKKNIEIERKIGYSKFQIKLNLIYRLNILLNVSYIFSILLSWCISKFVSTFYNINLTFNFKQIYLMVIFNFIICLIVGFVHKIDNR